MCSNSAATCWKEIVRLYNFHYAVDLIAYINSQFLTAIAIHFLLYNQQSAAADCPSTCRFCETIAFCILIYLTIHIFCIRDIEFNWATLVNRLPIVTLKVIPFFTAHGVNMSCLYMLPCCIITLSIF